MKKGTGEAVDIRFLYFIGLDLFFREKLATLYGIWD